MSICYLIAILMCTAAAQDVWIIYDTNGVSESTSAQFAATAETQVSFSTTYNAMVFQLNGHSTSATGVDLGCPLWSPSVQTVPSGIIESDISFVKTESPAYLDVKVNGALANGQYPLTFNILCNGGVSLLMDVTMTIGTVPWIPSLYWDQWSSGVKTSQAATPFFEYTMTYKYMQTTSFTQTIDLGSNSATQDGYNLIYPSIDTVTVSATSTLTTTVTFSSGSLTLSITGLTPTCPGTYSILVTFEDTTTSETTSITITLVITDTCYASSGTTIQMPTLNTIQYTAGTGSALNPSVIYDLSTVSSLGTTGCLGIVTTCSPTSTYIVMTGTSLEISYDPTITAQSTITVTCTATQSHYQLSNTATFDVVYATCPQLTLSSTTLPVQSANLQETTTLTWLWTDIVSLVSNYSAICQMQITSVSSTITNTAYYTVSNTPPLTADVTITIQLDNVALSALAAGSYPFQFKLKYLTNTATTALSAPVTLIDQCLTTTYAFPPFIEIRYSSGATYTQAFPLLDTYSTQIGKSVCGSVQVGIDSFYVDALGNTGIKSLNANTYPQFSSNILTIAENTTYYLDQGLRVNCWINGKGRGYDFTIKVIVCRLTLTQLVLSFQFATAGTAAVHTYSLSDLQYSFSYNNHPLCMKVTLTYVNCTVDAAYPAGNAAAFTSNYDTTSELLTINVDSTSSRGKYKLLYEVDMTCGGVESKYMELWVMIDASACTYLQGNFIPPTSYDWMIGYKKTLVRVGSLATSNYPTLQQKSAGLNCGNVSQSLYSAISPLTPNTNPLFSLQNQVLTVTEDISICVGIGNDVCIIPIYIRTYLVDQEQIQPVEVFDTFYLQYVNCFYSQIYFSFPLIPINYLTSVDQTLSMNVVSGKPADQTLTFHVSDTVSDRIAAMYCGTYDMQITAVNKTGDNSITVPLTELIATTVDKRNGYQTTSFEISDAYWPFYDNAFTDFYTFNFTWVTSPKNRYYGILQNPDFAPQNVSGSFDFSVSRCVMDNYTVATTPNQVFTLYVMNSLEFSFKVGQQNLDCKHAITNFVVSMGDIQSAYYTLDTFSGQVVLKITDSFVNQPIIGTYQTITYRPQFEWTPDLASDTTFTVFIENKCKAITLTSDAQIPDIVYNITDPSVVVQIPIIRDSVSQLLKIKNYCGPTLYTILHNNASNVFPFIWLQGTSIYINTESQNYVGVYDFVIQANIQTFSMNTVDLPFQLTIQQSIISSAIAISTTTPPVFTKNLEDFYSVLWNQTLELELTINSQSEVQLHFDWQSTSVIQHSYELSEQILSLQIGPLEQLIDETFMSQFEIMLFDSNGSSNYTVRVQFCSAKYYEEVILGYNQNGTNASLIQASAIQGYSNQIYSQYAARQSKAKITTISLSGKITISFSPMIDAIDQAIQIINSEQLMKVQYIRNSFIEQNFNWTLVSFTRAYAQIQCHFNQPLAVSQGDYPDQIQVQLSKSILVNHLPHRMLQQDYQTMTAFIPLQAKSEQDAVKLESQSNLLSQAAISVFWVFILLQFFAKSIIKNLWDIFNYLQILLAIPSFRLKFTVTLLAYSQAVEQIINLQIIPKEKIKAWLDSSSEEAEESYTAKIIILVISCAILFTIIFFIVKIRRNSFELLPKRIQTLFKNIEDRVMFSALIRTMIQSYLATSLATVLQLTNSGNKIAWFAALFILAYLVIFPYFTYKFQRMFRWKLREPETRKQYGTMYRDQDVYNLPAACWTMIFLYKRLIFAVIIVCIDIPILQVTLLSYLQIFALAYLIRVQPMVDVYSNMISLLNESSILFLTVFSLAFSDYVSDLDLRMLYGYWFLYIAATTIGLNVALLVVQYCVNRTRLNKLRKSQQQIKAQIRVKPHSNIRQKKVQEKTKTKVFEPKTQLDPIEEESIQMSQISQVQLIHENHPQIEYDDVDQKSNNGQQISRSIHIEDSYRPIENSQLSDLISHSKSLFSDHDWIQATSGMPKFQKSLHLLDNTLDHQLDDIEQQLRSPAQIPRPMQRSPIAQDVQSSLPVQVTRPAQTIQDIARPVQRQQVPQVQLTELRQQPNIQAPSKKPALQDRNQMVSFEPRMAAQTLQKQKSSNQYKNVVVQFK